MLNYFYHRGTTKSVVLFKGILKVKKKKWGSAEIYHHTLLTKQLREKKVCIVQ